MSSNMKTLVFQRTSIEHELDKIVHLGMEASNSPEAYRKFMASCSTLDRIQDRFDKIQSEIESLELTNTGEIGIQHSDIRSAFNDLVRDILASKFEFEFGNSNHHRNNFESSRLQKVDVIPAPLPHLPVQHFSGDYMEWKSFSDSFRNAIDKYPSLSDIAKYQYLLSYLKGDARRILRGIPVTESNYKKAWEILEYNFNNERIIAMHHMESIFSIPSVSTPSATAFRNILTGFMENTSCLDSMGFPVDKWDFILYFMLYKKIDPETRRNFERTIAVNKTPKFKELREFLDREIISFESSSTGARPRPRSSKGGDSDAAAVSRSRSSSSFVSGTSTSKSSNSCVLCHRGSHAITACNIFKNKSPYDRYLLVKEHKLCLKCFKPVHSPNETCSKIRCEVCKMSHHNTLLHYAKDSSQNIAVDGVQVATAASGTTTSGNSSNVVSLCSSKLDPANHQVLLSTAVVSIRDASGNFVSARALIDPASESSFITNDLVLRLGLARKKLTTAIQGIGDVMTNSKGFVESHIKGRGSKGTTYPFRGIILNKITTDKPSYNFDSSSWSYVDNLVLADPNFHLSSPIELLIGGDIYDDIFVGDTVRGPPGTPLAISSKFGWLLVGKVHSDFIRIREKQHSISSFVSCSQNLSLDSIVRKFWETESVPEKTFVSPDDQKCEDIFVNTHQRTDSGRYIVSIPFREDSPSLGDSHSLALKRLKSIERRFARDDQFHLRYVDFMDDYIKSGHMEFVEGSIPTDHYYIPHHGVLRASSTTTKLRTVFDASAQTDRGISLNDCQLVGPKLQKDVTDLLCNFRLHDVAFTADVKQMYRQILVAENQLMYQLILWRTSPDEDPKTYKLKTVTYGLSSSPFLAIRVMQQLAEDHRAEFPQGADVLQRFTYMDDVISGSDSVENAVELQRQLIDLLHAGGFELRKWCSNSVEFLEKLPASIKDIEAASVSLDDTCTIKVLGLVWQPLKDIFSYAVKVVSEKSTKRAILSEIARVFDPIGFLCPVIIVAKILIQDLWLLGIDWDEEAPQPIRSRWEKFTQELPNLENVQISRFVPTKKCHVELHGFCDSSESAYAAVIYFRVIDSSGKISIFIIAAKSRVAPTKKLSLPRLELNGALLLAHLFSFVRQSFSDIRFNGEFAWTDSTIVLAWLRASPHNWSTYVANRVSEIQSAIAPDRWQHVRSHDNPADCASRGLSPDQLIEHPLWWTGPSWLALPSSSWPSSPINVPDEVPERRVKSIASHATEKFEEPSELLRFSDFHRLQKVTAYCLRFGRACRSKDKQTGPLTIPELQEATNVWLKIVQQLWFGSDIRNLENNKPCSTKLQRLNPFLDESGLIRVGGRLRNSNLSYEQRHPVVLPSASHLTHLIIDFYHQINLHSGLQATLAFVSAHYWVLSARSATRQRIFKCIKCYRNRPVSLEPLMADLPKARIQQIRPFLKISVDYAGPISTKCNLKRKYVTQKSYIAIFVCLTTRALHVELVSDLSTNAFLAAFRRFIGRRGLCSDVYSDCGRNFVGATSELKEMYRFVESNHENFAHELLKFKISWHLNPPAAPHFNGMAEAAVKSVKSHLSRVIGNVVLTFEELTTVLVQIESVLNSRPICPLSSDSNDLEVLTPGHFLIGEPLNALPLQDLTEINVNRLSRWQLLQAFVQRFWNRWHNEYLNTLQQRGKWTRNQENIKLGALVLIQEPCSPLQWKLGRVTEVLPSKDGIIRAVNLKTIHGVLKRPVHKLCPLPLDN